MSWFINAKPSENGHYGNPQSNAHEGTIELPDDLLSAYIETMGFAKLTVKNGIVTKVAVNQDAYNAYQADHQPVEKTPAEKREAAYNNDKVIEWDGEIITVTEADSIWMYYAAEGNERADELQTLIKAAKAAIRKQYPDKE